MAKQQIYQLASPDATAPTSSSYWVLPDLLLGGAYPGAQDPEERRAKVQALVGAGVKTFINLMEEDETNYAGEPFVPYDDLAHGFCADAQCVRYPIKDLSVPSMADMAVVLATIDESLAAKRPVYVHCWGGVGRTGTVMGCWLIRHGHATPSNVLDVLMDLRKQDRERRHRMSPETADQQRFVKRWLDQEIDG
jgi:protein tyrosine/serine phosphatase